MIRCPRKVSLSDVTAHGDRAENAWGLGWCNRVLPFAISELRRELGLVSNFNYSINSHYHIKGHVEIGHLTKFGALRLNKDQVMTPKTWLKIHTNVFIIL